MYIVLKLNEWHMAVSQEIDIRFSKRSLDVVRVGINVTNDYR